MDDRSSLPAIGPLPWRREPRAEMAEAAGHRIEESPYG